MQRPFEVSGGLKSSIKFQKGLLSYFRPPDLCRFLATLHCDSVDTGFGAQAAAQRREFSLRGASCHPGACCRLLCDVINRKGAGWGHVPQFPEQSPF